MNLQTCSLLRFVKPRLLTKQYLCSVYHNRIVIPLVGSNYDVRNLTTSKPPLPEIEDEWIVKKFSNIRVRLGLSPKFTSNYRIRGLVHFQRVERLNWKNFFKTFQMEDTFLSWFLVIELHMWMLSSRLKLEGIEGEKIMKASIAFMWEEAKTRSKKLGASSSSLRESFDILYEEFLASYAMYDLGLLTSDATLAEALWYRFFRQECDDPQKLELLVKYVRMQIQHLDATTREDLIEKAVVSWLPLGNKL